MIDSTGVPISPMSHKRVGKATAMLLESALLAGTTSQTRCWEFWLLWPRSDKTVPTQPARRGYGGASFTMWVFSVEYNIHT